MTPLHLNAVITAARTLQLRLLLANSKKQAVSNISHPRHNHPPLIALLVDGTHPYFYALGPALGRTTKPRLRAENAEHDYPLHPPFAEELDGGLGRGAGRDDGVEQDGEGGSGGIGRGVGAQEREVIVVFDWLEGELVTEEAEMVDGDGGREEVVDSLSMVQQQFAVRLWTRENIGIPSIMPNPDRRIGTKATLAGSIVVVSYSMPSGVLSCGRESD